jgi:hypothetical protein
MCREVVGGMGLDVRLFVGYALVNEIVYNLVVKIVNQALCRPGGPEAASGRKNVNRPPARSWRLASR